jgi:predicted Zn-dependent protease
MPHSKSPTPGSKSKDAKVEFSHHRVERVYLKLLLGGFIGIILLVALFWGGHNAYVRWQEKRLVRRAMTAIEHGNEEDASLAARTVLQLKPSSVPATRIMAQLAEHAGNRAALDWRRKVAQLEPHSAEDQLAWARCALQFNDVATAERALSSLQENGKETAAYHAICALLAQAKKQDEKVESEWSEALRLAPEEKAYQLQLGALRARAIDPEKHASGEAMLKALRDDSKQRAFATRALISAGVIRHENGRLLLELARELQAYPEATWSDRLLFLDLLHQLDDPQFSSYLTELEKSAATKPPALASLFAWMSQGNLNLLALDFSTRLPADVLQKWPVPSALADVYVQLKDWHKLELATEKAQWQKFEFLRHAYLARALRAEDKSAAAEHEWAAAVKGASDESESLLMLVRTVSEWRWETEMTDLLWALSKYPEKQKEAFLTLYQYYSKTSDTQGLYRVLLRLFETDPTNPDVQNNLAQISLVLNADVGRARQHTADLYQKDPANAAYASTYAFSLYTQGKIEKARQVMAILSEDQRKDPAVAAYYGIILAGAGEKIEARKYLEIGKNARLLPEEKKLVDRAEAAVK